ncbi:Aldose 1-epimerase precursor [Fuerstiella marisgermanici]|uniref:Aldose 1-epimerase n=2 Tax=Fuerstiella marisgermanici TaxID=1891926 RepID=A0A1P8W9C0_9PLAN|nr:Aldose 1-epimerase precursor [Fuerstiella marisgermanici]
MPKMIAFTELADRILVVGVLFLVACGCGDSGTNSVAQPSMVVSAPQEPVAATVSTTSAPAVPAVFPLPEQDDNSMDWKHSEFGKTDDGQIIEQYTLTNSNGVTVRLINWGATVVRVDTPDKDGKPANIVLSYEKPEMWLKNPAYFGTTVGRYGNRIANGMFGLNGNIYRLAKNDGTNHLHGGEQGFHRTLWNAEATSDDSSVQVEFTRTSPDGEDGYPGNLQTSVTYSLNEDNELSIVYEATTDKPTVVNLTNHCYWNLTGRAAERDVLKHRLTLFCNLYLPVDEHLIPTGDTVAVANTAMNFVQPHSIGSRIDNVEGGYDHCFVVNHEMEGLVPIAKVEEPESGRVVEIFSTEPAVQFYSGNFLDGSENSGGFDKHHGLCLETQHYPDSPNQPHFPSTTLMPGETYSSKTVHRFSVAGQAAE